MNNGCSAATHSTPPLDGSAEAVASCHQASSAANDGAGYVSSSKRRKMMEPPDTSEPSARAASTAALAMPQRSMTLPPRRTPSAAITAFAPADEMRAASESLEKPPKTTVWTAPMRAHASMAMANSGTMGMKRTTRSPVSTPQSSTIFRATRRLLSQSPANVTVSASRPRSSSHVMNGASPKRAIVLFVSRSTCVSSEYGAHHAGGVKSTCAAER
mmetsp:Transcript_17986/g.56164  ORF Transcript_17986/g.56164 Transcript_17986/m.56164 type:complete len:215 (-) Transcript_17986:303-947(-)